MKNIGIILIIGFLLTPIPAPGFESLPDAGIILKISGNAVYSNKTDAQDPLPVQAFMKIRAGDSICLDKNSQITLYLSQSETRETWHGPAVLYISETGIKAETTPVHVEKLPVSVARQIDRSDLPVPRFRTTRTGGAQIRGMSDSTLKAASSLPMTLNEKDKADIRDAKKVYDNMKKQSQQDDYMPKLYLLSVLSKYEQYKEVESIVDELLKKDEKNSVFNHWKYWVQENYPVRPEMFLMVSDPSCEGSGCKEIQDMGKYKKTGHFSISQSSAIKAKTGNILTFNMANTSETDYYCYILNINSSGKWAVMFPDPEDGPDTSLLKAKKSYDLFKYAYFGLILDKPGKEIIRIYTSPLPVENSKLLKMAANGNTAVKTDDNIRILQLVIPVN